ncbi:MAG TPA: hypothetical protein VEA37_02870 [Flavobacterium sp.]|nr:hypothetical protein [Flavobacterium sp.]
MSKSNITGKAIDSTLLNLALYGELDPDTPRLTAEEKKIADELFGKWQSSNPLPGKVIITSTSGNCGANFKKLWDNGE